LISMPVPNFILSGHGWFIGLHLIIPLLPERGGGVIPPLPEGGGVYCFTSVRLQAIYRFGIILLLYFMQKSINFIG
jgi:hypothetical protein